MNLQSIKLCFALFYVSWLVQVPTFKTKVVSQRIGYKAGLRLHKISILNITKDAKDLKTSCKKLVPKAVFLLSIKLWARELLDLYDVIVDEANVWTR